MYEASGTGSDINKSCTKEPYPSKTNKHCIEFESVMGPNKMPRAGQAIVIIYKGKNQTICYGPSHSQAGWCGTCTYEQQQKGKPNNT